MKSGDIVQFINTAAHHKMYDESSCAFRIQEVAFWQGVINCKHGEGIIIKEHDIFSFIQHYKKGNNTPRLQTYLYGLEFILKHGAR